MTEMETMGSARLLSEYNSDKYKFTEGGERCLESGPRQSRSCTDMMCFVFFVICAGVFVCLSLYGLAEGNTKVLDAFLHPIDHRGLSCGLANEIHGANANRTEYPFAFFYHNESYAPGEFKVICTEKCPTNKGNKTTPKCSPNEDLQSYACGESWKGNNTQAAGPFCFDNNEEGVVLGEVENLHKSWPVLLLGFFMIILLGFVFLFMIKQCSGVLIGGTMAFVIVLQVAFGTFILANKSELQKNKQVEDGTIIGIAVGCYLGAAVFGLIALCMCKQIRVSIRLLETSAAFMLDVKSQMVQPIFFALAHILFTVLWVGCTVPLLTVGAVAGEGACCNSPNSTTWLGNENTTTTTTPTTTTTTTTTTTPAALECTVTGANPFCVKYDSGTVGVHLFFMIVIFLWVHGMISALSHFTTSYAAGVWYFAGDSETGERALPGGNTFCDWRLTFRGMGLGVWYHTGTFAFGALLCAICKILQSIASSASARNRGNAAQQVLATCLACCVDFIERFVSFISFQAYIQTALLGTGFCESGKSALSICIRNPIRTFLVTRFSNLMEATCIMAVTVTTLAIGYGLLSSNMVEGVDNFYPCLLILGGLSIAVSATMMHPYSTATMAIMHCFVADEEMSREAGHDNARHTPETLRTFVNEHAQA